MYRKCMPMAPRTCHSVPRCLLAYPAGSPPRPLRYMDRGSRTTGSVAVERQPWGTSWTSYRERNKKSKTAVARGRVLRSRLPSAILDKLNSSSPSCAPNFHHFAAPWTPRGSLTGGHVKVMLAYMATACPIASRAPCPSVLIIEKQQGKWGQQ